MLGSTNKIFCLSRLQCFSTRFAPSPTGHLHLGHVLSAYWVFDTAKELSADVIVRMEDHDQGRYKKEYEESILEDLAWLGYIDSDTKISYQRDKFTHYENTLNKLKEKSLIYKCDCSRKDIKSRMKSIKAGEELCYDSFCRTRQEEIEDSFSYRIKLEEKNYKINDLYLGKLEQTPSRQCGDVLMKDRHGLYSYLFSSTLDDMEDGVNLVIRGQDLTSSAARQKQIREMLGDKEDVFYLHHPLIVDENGKKLSKRSYSESIKSLKDKGMSSQDITELALRSLKNG